MCQGIFHRTLYPPRIDNIVSEVVFRFCELFILSEVEIISLSVHVKFKLKVEIDMEISDVGEF